MKFAIKKCLLQEGALTIDKGDDLVVEKALQIVVNDK